MALLAKEANCTKRSVINALKKIPKDELQIIARGQGKGNSNRYRLLLPLVSEKVKSTTEKVKLTTEKVKSDSPEPEIIIKESPIHSASGVAGESELAQMGYETDHAQIVSLWNKIMPPLGWLPVNAYSDEVVAVMEIWNEDYSEAEDLDLQTAAHFFLKAESPKPNRKPTFVRFMRDNFTHPLTAKQ